jgi:hypothetical protein
MASRTIATHKRAHSTSQDAFVKWETTKHFEYPLLLDYSSVTSSTRTTAVTTTVKQADIVKKDETLDSFPIFRSDLFNQVKSTDTLNFDSSGNFTGTSNRDSSQHYAASDSLGYCYDRLITSAAGLLTSIKDEDCRRH